MGRVQLIEVRIPAGERGVALRGALTVPEGAKGIVLLAHGSGGSRDSDRDRHVAAVLERARFATLRVDLLDEHEERDHHNPFDTELLGARLTRAAQWAAGHRATRALPLGYLGAGTGATAALVAAVREPQLVSALVLQGAHAHQAVSWLGRVRAPTLHIVAELDDATRGYCEICGLDRASDNLTVVPGARHLLDEPETLERTTAHACEWFERHFGPIKPVLPRDGCGNGSSRGFHKGDPNGRRSVCGRKVAIS
jgi:predicted alpha/beta-hydrolase family hydrolase